MRKLLIIALFFGMSYCYGQAWDLDEILEMKNYGVSEEEILSEIKNRGFISKIDKQVFLKLREQGFSLQFIRKFREHMEKQTSHNIIAELDDGQKYFTIRTIVKPQKAGKIVLSPRYKEQKFPANTIVTITPKAFAPFLFDYWSGDAKGYHPLKIYLNKDITIVGHFRKAKPADQLPEIKDPEQFKDTRRQGYLYRGEVVGLVEGKGVNKDWGLAAEVNYKYVYHLNYSSEVISNDGYRIYEKRTFDAVKEMLMVSKYSFRLDVSEDFEGIKEYLKKISRTLRNIGDERTRIIGQSIGISILAADEIIARLEKVVFDTQKISSAFDMLEPVFGEQVKWKKLRSRFTNPAIARILGYSPNMKLLEGKSFFLTYEDGVGLTKVEIANEGQILTAREKELLERICYLSDYYIFRDKDQPQRELKPGATWKVDARTLAGVLDPRLRHKAKGFIQLSREQNSQYQHREVANFRLQKAVIKMKALEKTEEAMGNASFTDGEIIYDLDKNYIAKARLAGTMQYRQISKDHLFFRTRLSTTPKVSIVYKCSCVKKKN